MGHYSLTHNNTEDFLMTTSQIFILFANLNGQKLYWTGRAGEAWVSADRSEAFAVSWDEAHRKAELFNQASSLHSMTFEVEVVFQVGDRIRSWDFQPCEGRADRYVEGVFERISDDGRLVIRCAFDSTNMGREGQEILTPIVMFITDFDGRLAYAPDTDPDEDLANKLFAYAEEHYNDGFDTFVECGREYCREFVEGLTTWDEVLDMAKKIMSVVEERRADADYYAGQG